MRDKVCFRERLKVGLPKDTDCSVESSWRPSNSRCKLPNDPEVKGDKDEDDEFAAIPELHPKEEKADEPDEENEPDAEEEEDEPDAEENEPDAEEQNEPDAEEEADEPDATGEGG